MKPYEEMQYHHTAERVVSLLQAKTQVRDPLYFRVVTGFYFALAASHMRCSLATPDRGEIPVNMFALNLAPTGFGKTLACNFMEEQILNQFRNRFINETFPLLAETNLPKLANKRARRNGADPDDELVRVQREFDHCGPVLFSFDSGTGPAIKQQRHKIIMAGGGSLNLIMDEVGNNLEKNAEVFDIFIELYDKGLVKQKLVKSTTESVRSEEIIAKTPTNLMMFGVPGALLDGGRVEEELMRRLEQGYARRCFFGYVRKVRRAMDMTPEEIFAQRTDTSNSQTAEELSDRFDSLADMINVNKKLIVSKETSLLLIEYELDCQARAAQLHEFQDIQKHELTNRFFKAMKLAGAYAFIDDSPEVTQEHVYNAIKLTEDSGHAFDLILSRDRPWVKLAKYIAAIGTDITQADLSEDLPFYKGGVSQKQEMITQAIAYGYKNNIIIKKSYADGIEFFRGESLKETKLSEMVVSYSTDIVSGYRNELVAFDQLSTLTQAVGYHWVAHHLKDGYRDEEHAVAGTNMVVLDVDGGTKISTARELLKDYKYLLYTTKRHTPDEHRFRLILPLSHIMKLDMRDYKEFMSNIYEWLPFDVDTATGQRARKWLSHADHFEYNDGELLDVLPFIPKTVKNEERKSRLDTQQSMDNLERWMMNHIGDGNRNNMLLRYAMILVDAGFDFDGVRGKVMALNNKIADKLDEVEIISTIMVSVGKAIAARP
jgi:hypothetical protein